MGIVVSRPLEYANRLALQNADQAIKRDVIRALVELITNADDSYRRLEGDPVLGRIVLDIQRKDRNAVIRVTDFAQGISGEDMDVYVGKYAEATSGFLEGRSVRGLWGRGLKDAIFGLGHGTIVSIKEGLFTRCTLGVKDGVPHYDRFEPTKITRALREACQIPGGNGTVIEIIVSRNEIAVPQIDNLRRYLQLHYELRQIMQSDNRSITLRYLSGSGKIVKGEFDLKYRPPLGQQLLDEEFEVPGFEAKARLVLFKAEDPLSTPSEEGDFAEGGFVFISGSAAIGLSMLKFESNEFGTCQ